MKSIRWLHLPYCVCWLDDGSVTLLNRSCRYLGQEKDNQMSDVDFVAYLKAGSVKHPGLTRSALEKLTLVPLVQCNGYEQGWLYKDGSVPTRSKENWAAYAARLEKLAQFGD